MLMFLLQDHSHKTGSNLAQEGKSFIQIDKNKQRVVACTSEPQSQNGLNLSSQV